MCKKMICLFSFVSVLALVLTNFAQADLIGWWRFDESSGTIAADSAGGDNDGTLSENVQWQLDFGKSGGALLWDGTDSAHVEFPTTGMSATTGTFAAWGYLSDPQPGWTRYFFGHTTQPSYSNRIQLYMDNTDTGLDLGLGDSHARLSNIMILDTEVWYHVALTWDNGNYVVYVNGQDVANGIYSGLETLHPFAWIGNDGNPVSEGVEAFGGMLDEVRLYNVALNAAEILAAMDMLGISELEPFDPGTDGLVAYYPLENDVSDNSGNGNDGIVEGDPTYVEGPAGYGMAMEFDGDDYVDTGNTEDLAEWTIACWAKSPSAPSGEPSSASGPVHRDRNYQFNWNHQNDVPRGSVAVRSAGGWHAASLGTLKADIWYHLAGTYDGEELKAYKDGVLITTNDAPSGPPLAEAGTLKLGKHATAEQFFTGTVDEAIVYSRVLSVGEIRYLAGGANIILVTEAIDWDMDGLRDDHSLESFLVSEGHSVDIRPDYWKGLTPDKIAELNAADLIIFSRLAWSDRYNDGYETTQWNSITTPLLQMNSHFTQNTRWKWVNSWAGTPADDASYIYAETVEPYHPIFRGVPLTALDPSDPGSPLTVVQMVDPLIGTGLTSFINSTNMGNGHLIAKPVQLDMGWIAEWDVGVEFFDSAGQYAGGKRMLFCAGTLETQSVDPDTQEVMTTAQGELNLTAEGLQMFRNAIDYLLNPDFTGGIIEPRI